MISFDTITAAIFFLVQIWITVLLVRAAARRMTGMALALACTAIFAFDLVLIAGYAFSYSSFLSRHHLAPKYTMLLGGATLSYLFLATSVMALYTVLRAVDRRLLTNVDPIRRRALRTGGKVLMAAPAVALGYGSFIERRNFRVSEVDLALPGLPAGLEGLRLLQLSDIHLSAFLSENELAGVIDAANELRPHLALVTGDLISSRGDPLDVCIHQISRLKSDAGTFGCLGNHERYANAEDYTTAAAARRGIQFLRDKANLMTFGDSRFNLVGVDYQRKQDDDYLQGAERLIVPDAFNVLLSHNPNVFPAAVRRGYALTLAGHTHGGQVTVEILHESINPARFFTPFVHGVYREGASAVHVTRGIGTIGMPVRLGMPPEISLIRLRKA